jgi:hypothetical protein
MSTATEPKTLKQLCAEQNIHYETALEQNCANWAAEAERLGAKLKWFEDREYAVVNLRNARTFPEFFERCEELSALEKENPQP